MTPTRIAALLALCSAAGAEALAQPLGTFGWQLQPFCNLITVNVTQRGGIYTLDGTDDRCGGGNQPGSVVGIASLMPGGNVSFGLTSVLPNGAPVHTEATISIASLGGTWRDSAGNSGAFVFTPGAAIGGAPRPVSATGLAAGSITNVLIAPNAVTGANVVDASLSSSDLLDAPRAAAAGGNQQVQLTDIQETHRQVTITAPVPGTVIVHAAGWLFMQDSSTIDGGRCSVSQTTTHDPANEVHIRERAAGAMERVPFAIARGIGVAAGVYTFRLICDRFAGSNNLQLANSGLTAIFISQ